MTGTDAGLTVAERSRSFQPRSVSVMIHGPIGTVEVMGDPGGIPPGVSGGASETANRAKWEKVSDLMDAGLRAQS
jgi:DNA polymerase-4